MSRLATAAEIEVALWLLGEAEPMLVARASLCRRFELLRRRFQSPAA